MSLFFRDALLLGGSQLSKIAYTGKRYDVA